MTAGSLTGPLMARADGSRFIGVGYGPLIDTALGYAPDMTNGGAEWDDGVGEWLDLLQDAMDEKRGARGQVSSVSSYRAPSARLAPPDQTYHADHQMSRCTDSRLPLRVRVLCPERARPRGGSASGVVPRAIHLPAQPLDRVQRALHLRAVPKAST